jgi:hypothetical protein
MELKSKLGLIVSFEIETSGYRKILVALKDCYISQLWPNCLIRSWEAVAVANIELSALESKYFCCLRCKEHAKRFSWRYCRDVNTRAWSITNQLKEET